MSARVVVDEKCPTCSGTGREPEDYTPGQYKAARGCDPPVIGWGPLREKLAKVALDAAHYDSSDEPWTDPSRAPRDDDGYAGEHDDDPVEWEYATDWWRSNGYRIADAVLAVMREAR